MEWWKKFCYSPSLDEIDPELPDGEKTIRQIAKHTSKICLLLELIIIFPIMILPFFLDKFFGEIFTKLMVLLVFMPVRYILYYLIYLPLKLPVMILGDKK
ncbi:hypothetical protein NG798_14415 [Ancylothrix sp. C2]|uniref:hypothetical protein n=1 Tax=Ancylothrix sp. D3o TaxID=2953691 RepID=UPI0021BB3255|nr:hypothetical protein [Ancylothrix sp. D3o]MCT7950989.1 hypothetical protein [Ancylothrix sp. D3o]